MKHTMKMPKRISHGFTLLELMVVITIIALLATMSMPAYSLWVTKARMTKDVSNQKQIITALRLFAFDNEGSFPKGEQAGAEFSSSTEAFKYLIRETDLGTEEIFFTQGNPQKTVPPNNDGDLVKEENCMSYVLGMTDTSPARAPIVADEMESPGTYGDTHPWLNQKKAVVGYVGGQVKIEKITSNRAGATVKVGDIQDIFQPGEQDDQGKYTGGFLPAGISSDKVLIP
jgi:prepilin-type N-terminal cleavage/methylation domain-containing protein